VGNSLAVPRELRELVRSNWLGWQTTLPAPIGTQRHFGPVSNPNRANSMAAR
jgi:hypothetical protein